MIERQNYLPVNWVDGMKINKNHFLEMQHYTTEGIRDARGVFVTPITYGLLPFPGKGPTVKINTSIDNHNLLRVHVDECFAITPNGSRIEISSINTREETLHQQFVESTYSLEDSEAQNLLINISVSDTYEVPFGEINPKEQPPRYPYLVPKYQLSLVPVSRNHKYENEGYELTIGLIELEHGEVRLKNNYIPPCTSTNAHELLKRSFFEIDRFFGQLELLTVQISKKINVKNQGNTLSDMLLVLCEQMSTYLGSIINEYRWNGMYKPPVYIYEKPIALARLMKNFIDAKSGSGKEELLNYFSEWCGLSQADFEVLYAETININYEHTQISKINDKVLQFVNNTLTLFEALNKLDYIGRRKDTGIFVKERNMEQDITKGKRSRSFLDE